MGWFANIFKKKKTIDEVRNWVDEELSKQEGHQRTAQQKAEQDFPGILNTAKRALNALEQAELQNPNIPERAKHIMAGNREQFLKLTARYIDNLIIPQSGPDFSQLELISHDYTKQSGRPAAILSEFFGDHIKKLRTAFASLEQLFAQLKIEHEKIESLQHIIHLLKDKDRIVDEQHQIQKEQERLKQQREQLATKLENIKKEKEDLTQKPDYQQVKHDIIFAARARQEAQQAITDLFSPLSEPLKKYAYKKKNERLAKYSENPLEELIQDYSLAILKYVDELIAAITKEELGISPERAQKALDSLKQFDKDYLGKLIHTYANSKKRETDIHNDVAQRPVMKEYEQYAQDIKTLTKELEELDHTIAKMTELSDEHVLEQLSLALKSFNISLT